VSRTAAQQTVRQYGKQHFIETTTQCVNACTDERQRIARVNLIRKKREEVRTAHSVQRGKVQYTQASPSVQILRDA
jgi:hypothetical protein